MRKIILAVCLAVAGMANGQQTFKLQGTVDKNVNYVKYRIYYENEEGLLRGPATDSVMVNKGKFTLTKNLSEPTTAVFTGVDADNKPGAQMVLILMPGETLKLTVKDGEYTQDGSNFYKQVGAADKVISPLEKDLNEFYSSSIKKMEAATEAEREALSKEYREGLSDRAIKLSEAQENYFKSHLNEEGTVMALYADVTGAEETLTLLSPEMKNGRVGKYLEKRLQQQMARLEKARKEAAEREAAREKKAGTPAKDFTLNDLDGKPLSLSSLRGKYVILDFWGSWCVWCIKGVPDMKKYYEKYAGKFEILGIDCRDTEEAWKAAVKEYELPWKHVYNPKNGTITNDYEIEGYPTKIIIDPEGKIVKIIVGEDPAFYDYLDELFGK